MKKISALMLTGLFASFAFANDGSVTEPLVTKWIPDTETTIIKHKKGYAPVLVLKGDRGTGLVIEQGNKDASGIVMSSGAANLEISPSYVAAGMPAGTEFTGGYRETAAAVFKVSGAKLPNDGAEAYFSFDYKRGKIYMINSQGLVEGYLDFVQP